MKMPDLSRSAAGVVTIALVCGVCGCSPSVEAPDSSVRANAMEDYQAGNYDAAIAGFERVLKNNPKDHLAHFQLAIALQDKRKDYLGALVHYSLYLELRPEDDKTTQAADRILACKDMLLEEHARKTGNAPVRKAASAGDDKKQAAEIARLTAEVERLKNGNKKLSDTLRKLESGLDESDKVRMAGLRAEVEKTLSDLGVSEKEESHRRSINPTDAELLDDDSEEGPLVSSAAVKGQISKVKSEEASGPARPTPIKKPPLIVDSSPEPDPKPADGVRGGGLDGVLGGNKRPSGAVRPSTYRVQPRDTLQGVAMRFYGSRSKWKEIFDANRTTISADQRLKVGQIIKLP